MVDIFRINFQLKCNCTSRGFLFHSMTEFSTKKSILTPEALEIDIAWFYLEDGHQRVDISRKARKPQQ